jgi:hypothetical protein
MSIDLFRHLSALSFEFIARLAVIGLQIIKTHLLHLSGCLAKRYKLFKQLLVKTDFTPQPKNKKPN